MLFHSTIRVRNAFASGLDLPPPYRAVALREAGDAFTHACDIAGQQGAGTLVHVGRFDVAEFAVVLEPEQPLSSARCAVYAGMAALAEALAAHAPPEKPMQIVWPDAIMIDGGLVGGARLAWPSGADEDRPPDWLVFAAMIRTAASVEEEPGRNPLATSLDAEGFADFDSARLIESFARHFMAAIDAWQRDGFGDVARNYLSRLVAEGGVRRSIDDNGDLLLQRTGKAGIERRPLKPALAQPSWFDPATGAPRQ